MAKPKTWCVNFDSNEEVLNHGLTNNLWMMQYQFSHDGHTYQGGSQSNSTSKNWKRLNEIKAGDFLVAYVPSNRFYAVGKVRTPRKECTQDDTIERVTNDHTHNDTGVVRYTLDSVGLNEEMDYDNFKSKVARHQGSEGADYEHSLHEVWSVMNRLQK